jgi:hypothetical protein
LALEEIEEIKVMLIEKLIAPKNNIRKYKA